MVTCGGCPLASSQARRVLALASGLIASVAGCPTAGSPMGSSPDKHSFAKLVYTVPHLSLKNVWTSQA